MGKYLKLFDTTSEYVTYRNGENYIKPNVSLCSDNNTVYYNYYQPLTIKYNITQTTSNTPICWQPTAYTKAVLDGIEISPIVTRYTFDTLGEHTIEYTLKDYSYLGEFGSVFAITNIVIPNGVTNINNGVFQGCWNTTAITIPNSVTTIGASAFVACSGLTSVNIPNSVTTIGNYTFGGCSGLTNITIEATTPPTLGSIVFDDTNNCPIYVPSASVDAYKAASGWSTYASRIQAIP